MFAMLLLTSCMGTGPEVPETMMVFNRYEVTAGNFQLIGGAIILVVSGIMFGFNKWWDSNKDRILNKKKSKKA